MASTQPGTILNHVRKLVGAPAEAEPADADLLARFAAGRDEAAFAALLRRHGPMVLAVGRRVLGRQHDAEDVFQATFLLLARNAPSIRKRESVAGWLHGVAYRLALKARKDEARRRTKERRAARMAEQAPDATAWRELQALLDEALHGLPEKYRAALLLCCLEGKSHEEAARELGCPLGTINSRIVRGRELLRKRLARRGVTLSTAALATALTAHSACAAVPAALSGPTVKASLGYAAGKAVAGLVSESTAALLRGALRTIAVSRVLALSAALVTACTLAVAGAALSQPGGAEEPPAKPQPQSPPAPIAERKPRTDRFGDPLPQGALARLGTVRFRHGNGATLAFSADGKSLLTCGGDRTIRFWDPDSGRLLRQQRLPAGPLVRAAVLSPDGRLLAFQDFMDAFYLWDVARNRLRHKLPLGERGWYQAAFSPDGKSLVTTRYQTKGVLKVWDVRTGQGRPLGRHKRGVSGLSFTADGTLMSMSGLGHEIIFWDLARGRERSRLTIPEHVVSAAVSPDGRTIAVWSWHNPEKDKGVQFWDAATGKPAKGWIAPDLKRVRVVRFAPDGKSVLIGAKGGLLVWDPAAGKRLRTLPGGKGFNLTFSPDGKTVAELGPAAPDNLCGTVLHVWDFATGKPRAANDPSRGHLGEVDGIAFAPDGRIVATSCQFDRSVRLWDAATGRLLRSLGAEDLSFHDLAFSPNGKHLFAGTSPAILRWEAATGREAGRYPLSEPGKEERYHLMAMHLSDDGRTLLAISQNLGGGARGYSLHAWDVATGKRFRSGPLPVEGFLLGYTAFSPKGRLLLLPNGSIRDAATGKELLRLSIKGKLLGDPLAFSPDGALIAMTVKQVFKGPDWQRVDTLGVQVWELATRSPVVRLKTGKLAHLAFTPDGRRLITAGPDALKLWDLVSGKVVAQRSAPGRFCGAFGASFASSLALAADGRTVATGHPNTTALLWNLAPPTRGQPAAPRTAGQLELCWADLAGEDAGKAHAAVWALVASPKQGLRLLRERLKPAALDLRHVRRLLADLESRKFEDREAASKELKKIADRAESLLREALKKNPSLELRRRVEELLPHPILVRSPETLRCVRAIGVLEQIGTREARRLLEKLAEGVPAARVTREAKASLARLARKAGAAP